MASKQDGNSPNPPSPPEKLTPAQEKLLREFKKTMEEIAARSSAPDEAQKFTEALEKERMELKIKQLTDQIKKLQAERRKTLSEEEILEQIKATIFDLAQRKPKVPDWVSGSTAKKKGDDRPVMVPMVIASDWHYGEVVAKKEVAGANEFNMEIGNRRIKDFVENVVKTARSRNYNYPGIVFALGGDMISGDDLHQELSDTNQAKTAEVLLHVQGQLIASIQRMADEFGNVFVPCVVGNHGRNTQKPRFKKKVHTNYEWILYRQLEKHFKNDPRVTFLIPDEADAHFKVQNHRYMMTHGDTLGVNGGDGIIGVIGPVMRGKVKLSSSEKQMGRDFDTLLMGHWHTYISLNGVIVNGSLKGYDEYARLALRASYEVPTQAMWFNHPVHGPTDFTPIRLEEKIKPSISPKESSWKSLIAVRPGQADEVTSDKVKDPFTAKPPKARRVPKDIGHSPN